MANNKYQLIYGITMANKEERLGLRVSETLRNEIQNYIGEGKEAETESQFIRIAISEKIAKCKGCA